MSGIDDRAAWKMLLKDSSSRLQWDPDYDPYGNKMERRAIQVGIRNELIASYREDDLIEIEDISEFVAYEYEKVKKGNLDQLRTPMEKVLLFEDDALNKKLYLK